MTVATAFLVESGIQLRPALLSSCWRVFKHILMRLVAITGWEIVFKPSKMFEISKFFPLHMGTKPELFNIFYQKEKKKIKSPHGNHLQNSQ